VISSYNNAYIGASNTSWKIDLERNTQDFRAWDLKDSNYSDADYVIIQDFTSLDYLSLSGSTSDWWIGRAPSFFGENNVRPVPSNPLSGISTTEFGIYRSGIYDKDAANQTGAGRFPDLVAVIRTSGGLELDLSTLVQVAPGGTALTPSAGLVSPEAAADGHLGWGAFFSLSQAEFNDGRGFSTNSVVMNPGTFASTIQTPSTASLPDLMDKIS
jgi:hypothetical protein